MKNIIIKGARDFFQLCILFLIDKELLKYWKHSLSYSKLDCWRLNSLIQLNLNSGSILSNPINYPNSLDIRYSKQRQMINLCGIIKQTSLIKFLDKLTNCNDYKRQIVYQSLSLSYQRTLETKEWWLFRSSSVEWAWRNVKFHSYVSRLGIKVNVVPLWIVKLFI